MSSSTARTSTSARFTWRLLVAFALGCAASLSGFLFGMPGNGEFVLAIWLASFLALLIAPGWPGFAALLAGVTVSAAILDISDGVFGLLFLILAIAAALAAHGALSASVLRRLSMLGWRQGSRDPRVLVGGTMAIALGLAFVWFAGALAQNPP